MARNARSVRFGEEEDFSGSLQDQMIEAAEKAGTPIPLREFTLGNPELRDLSAKEEVYRWKKKQEAYGADGSQIFDRDEVVAIGRYYDPDFYFLQG